MVPTIPTLNLGPESKHYIVELGTYPDTKQPKLLLVEYGSLGPKLVLTYFAPKVDLRAYDADFAFKRRHALIRCDGEFGRLYQELVRKEFLRPTEDVMTDGKLSARVCQIDLTYCILPFDEEDTHGSYY